jgi:hypothetical protein
MHDLPEPPVTTGQADNPLTDSVMQAAVRDFITQTSYRNPDPDVPSHKDGPRVGDTPPVAQPDSRIVPPWALGIAVASIGVGVGSIGLGCAVWLACKGLSSVIHSLSSVTLAGVLTVAVPFAGAAMLATAIGGAISKAKKAVVPDVHIHNGTEYHEHRIDQRRSLTSKTINKR